MPRHGWQECSLQRGGACPFEAGAHNPDDVSAFEQRMNGKGFRLKVYSVLYGQVGVIIVLANLSDPSASDISRLRINMPAVTPVSPCCLGMMLS